MPFEPHDIVMVVGLGNPGDEYAATRHNAGFATADVLAGRWDVSYWKSQAGAQVAQLTRNGKQLILAKPLSFMNASGGPVSKLAAAYELAPQSILVIHDELDIPAGDVRVKLGGGHAGHNGLRSICDKLGSRDFCRVRVGIGRPPGRMDAADFVLRQLKGEFAEDFAITVQHAADAVEACLDEGVVAARDSFNGMHRDQTGDS